ncbi:MAG: TIGR02281 family clan AA aspartic protease [Sulfurifustaceae bacterium]
MLILLTAICASGLADAGPVITLQALFKDKAIFVIDGARRVLAKGEASPEGVRLVSTDTAVEQAEVEVAGRREVVKLGVVMSGFQPTTRAAVTLWAGSGGHFYADGMINGQPVHFLVDTGATMIALSGDEARRLGIDYRRNGRPGTAATAGGVVRSYALTLEKVEVGAIVLYNVEAGVLDGPYPHEALLGMSFLGRLNMKRDGEQLELSQR